MLYETYLATSLLGSPQSVCVCMQIVQQGEVPVQDSCPVSKISISCSKRPTWLPASFGLQKVCACMQTVATGVKFLSRMQAEAMQGTLDALQVCPHPTPF